MVIVMVLYHKTGGMITLLGHMVIVMVLYHKTGGIVP